MNKNLNNNFDNNSETLYEMKETLFEIKRILERTEKYADMTAGSTHTVASGYFEYLRNIKKGGEE